MTIPGLTARIVLCACLSGLTACGGGGSDGDPPPAPQAPPPPGTVIGPAGGTVTGPNGASVVIPAGALAVNTTINISLSSPGTAALPGSFTSQGQMYALTPHGTTFALPVTVTLPHDPAQVPANRLPAVYKTNAQGLWTEIVGATFGATTVSAHVTSFSEFVNGFLRHDPKRDWEFTVTPGDGSADTFVSGTPATAFIGELVDEFGEFGTTPFDFMSIGLFESDPRVGIAHGEVFSTPNGVTFEVFAESPNGLFGTPDPIGSTTTFRQSQSYEKLSDDARLTFTVTRIVLYNVDLGPTPEDDTLLIESAVNLAVRARLHDEAETEIYSASGGVLVLGHGDVWFPHIFNNGEYRAALWREEQFDAQFEFISERGTYGPPSAGITCPGSAGTLTLRDPVTFSIDVSDLDLHDEFTVDIVAQALTSNRLGGGQIIDCRGSYSGALLRDPAGTGGATIAFRGLAPTNRPISGSDTPPLLPPAPCLPGPGPDPAAGVLQFSAPDYRLEENARRPAILVTRSGGATGAVTATFTTSDGTAIAGADYTAMNGTLFFADGEQGSRFVDLRPLQDAVSGEPDKTVSLTLSQPGGCAALGAQTAATLTIVDDDIPPPLPSFTVGGTVSGLVDTGQGLTLQDHRFDSITVENGAFTFSQPTQSGQPYAVTILTQPTNPVQVCAITNGSGTVGNANVTHIAVNCSAPPAPGGLDPGFGGGTGKVSSAFGGDETDMLLLPDGKILMIGGSATDFMLARYNANGTPDVSFDSDGLVTTDIAGGADAAFGAAILPDGDIVVVGSARVGGNDDFAIVRYDENGAVDTAFGTQGKTTTEFFGARDRAHAVAVFPDGSLVVAGETLLSVGGGTDFAVARYTAGGVLDPSFSTDGKLNTDIAGQVDIARNVAIESGGTILVTGTITMGSSPVLGHTGLARYSASGAPDSSIGAGGVRSIPNLSLGDGLALQADGRILVAGNAIVAGDTHFGVMRLQSSGVADGSFGSGGLATAGFTTNDDYGRDVVIDAAGNILVSGQAANLVVAEADFAVARFTPGGTLDPTFDDDGKFTVDFFDASDSAENVAIQPDGMIVLGGFAVNGTSVRYGLARFNP